MKLERIVEMNVGQNVTRLRNSPMQQLKMYSNEDLQHDLCVKETDLAAENYNVTDDDKFIIHTGDILYNLINAMAVIVSRTNDGKVINQNFVKLAIKNNKIDSKYLCYILNESESIKRQKYILMQGSVTPKITPAILRDLEINLPELTRQKIIGRYYFNLNRYCWLQDKRIKILQKVSISTLNDLN